MHLASVKREKSPDTADCLRLTGVLKFASGEELSIWVDVPMALADEVSISGNPWLVAMLPMAASRGENISLSIPVDALLLENLRGVLAIWRDWYPELHDVAIECPVADHQEPTATKTAAFFSGGIDSYFTIARRMPANPYGLPVVGRLDDLITVWGFDVGVHDAAEFLPMAASLSSAACEVGLNHVVIRTNLRDAATAFRRSWGPLSFGAGLGFIGLMLERRVSQLVLGSSYPFRALVPWGSHPMVDPLFSTSSLRIVHDGAGFSRIAKTEVAASLPSVRATLHVCQLRGVGNCSRCEKCYRTMIALDILGRREDFADLFDWSMYRHEDIKRIYMGRGHEQIFYTEMAEEAKARGQTEIALALEHAKKRSTLLAPLVSTANRLMRIPVLWQMGRTIHNLVARSSITALYIEHRSK